MRKQINENPVVQIALIGVMVLAFGFLFATRVLNGGGSSAPATPPASTPEAAASASATPADSAAAGAAAAEPVTGATAVPDATGGGLAPGASTPAEFAAGPGLPKAVVAAYELGDTVVLLVHKSGGLDDRTLRPAVERLRSHDGLALFVARASGVSRYSRITQGVEMDRVPALIVVRPRGASDGPPEASVSYGFRRPESVFQAVRDARYNGKALSYHP